MKHLWSIICNKLIVDKNTNSATLVDILEEIRIEKSDTKGNKILPIFFDLVSLWGVEDEIDYEKENNVIIEFYDSKKKKLNEFKFSFFVPNKRKRVGTNIRFDRFFYEDSGSYSIKIKHNNKEVGEIPLEVIN